MVDARHARLITNSHCQQEWVSGSWCHTTATCWCPGAHACSGDGQVYKGAGLLSSCFEGRSGSGQDLLCVPGFLFCALPWGCSSFSMATTGPEPTSRPSCPGGTLVCPRAEVHSGWTGGCIPPEVCRRVGWTVKTPCRDRSSSAISHSHFCCAWCVLLPHLPSSRAVLVTGSRAGSVALPGELNYRGRDPGQGKIHDTAGIPSCKHKNESRCVSKRPLMYRRCCTAPVPLPLNTIMSSDGGSRRCFFIPSWGARRYPGVQGLSQMLLSVLWMGRLMVRTCREAGGQDGDGGAPLRRGVGPLWLGDCGITVTVG